MKFYRTEHKSIIAKETNWHLGSWRACHITTNYFDNSFKNKLRYYSDKINDPKSFLLRFECTPASKMPVTWSELTPGPARDPYLREWYFNTYVKGNYKGFVFGTNSIEQMEPWLNKEMIELLDSNGFVLRLYKSRHIIQGLRQSVMATDKPSQKLKEYSIKKVFG